MNPRKRVGVVALLVVLAALFAASPALAGGLAFRRPVSTTYKLAPPVHAPEPRASGTWTLDQYLDMEGVTVSCRRVTPGEQYTVVVLVDWYTWQYSRDYWRDSGSSPVGLPVTADARGRLDAQFWVYSESSWHGGYEGGWWSGTDRHVADVWIVNATTGEVVLEEPEP